MPYRYNGLLEKSGTIAFEKECLGADYQLRKTQELISQIESWETPTPLNGEERQKEEARQRKIEDIVRFIERCGMSDALSYDDYRRMEYEAYLTGELLGDAAQWGNSVALRREDLRRLEYEQHKIAAYLRIIEQWATRNAAQISPYTATGSVGLASFAAACNNAAQASLAARDWDESKHPRDDRGRFGHGSGGGSSDGGGGGKDGFADFVTGVGNEGEGGGHAGQNVEAEVDNLITVDMSNFCEKLPLLSVGAKGLAKDTITSEIAKLSGGRSDKKTNLS